MSESMDLSFKLLLALSGSAKHEGSMASSSAPLGETQPTSQLQRLASTLPDIGARVDAYSSCALRSKKTQAGWRLCEQ